MANVERLFMEVNNVLYEFDTDAAHGCHKCALKQPRGGCDGSRVKDTKIAKYCCEVRKHMPIGRQGWWSWKKISG